MNWHVEIAKTAEDDMEEIYQFIVVSLGEPGIAWKQTERIHDKIWKLDFMPERNPVISEEPWKSREIRRVNIDNYAAFCVLDSNSATATIIRILYSRRDLNNISWSD
jgi:toxin ParE1/3/4